MPNSRAIRIAKKQIQETYSQTENRFLSSNEFETPFGKVIVLTFTRYYDSVVIAGKRMETNGLAVFRNDKMVSCVIV